MKRGYPTDYRCRPFVIGMMWTGRLRFAEFGSGSRPIDRAPGASRAHARICHNASIPRHHVHGLGQNPDPLSQRQVPKALLPLFVGGHVVRAGRSSRSSRRCCLGCRKARHGYGERMRCDRSRMFGWRWEKINVIVTDHFQRRSDNLLRRAQTTGQGAPGRSSSVRTGIIQRARLLSLRFSNLCASEASGFAGANASEQNEAQCQPDAKGYWLMYNA